MREFAAAFYSSQAWKDCRSAYVKSVYATFESVPAKPKTESRPADKEKSKPADAATI